MQEKEKLYQIFPEAFVLWPPQAAEAKGQGLNYFTWSKGWKTNSWGYASAFTSSSSTPPSNEHRKIEMGNRWDEVHQSLDTHPSRMPCLPFLLKNPEVKSCLWILGQFLGALKNTHPHAQFCF